MLWNIAIVLLLMWLLGMIGFQAIGAYVHILLILAIALAFAGPIRAQGKKITFLTAPWGVPPDEAGKRIRRSER